MTTISKKEKEIVALTRCYFCGGSNTILISKRMSDISHLNGKVVDRNPCPECEKYMKQGVMVIVVRDGEQDNENPYRTGQLMVLKDEAIKRMFEGHNMLDRIIESRCCFMEESIAKHFGLNQ